MALLSVYLFGKFAVCFDERPLSGFQSSKAQELFCYLLLNRAHSYPRETLAGLLWGESSTSQAKKFLRQALWQLHAALDADTTTVHNPLLQVGQDRIQVSQQAEIWIDAGAFEQAYAHSNGIPCGELDDVHAEELQRAIMLYQDDLLVGWYQDWCIYERERLQNMYMVMLDKLMGYCEAHHEYDRALSLGARLLRLDHAHERTHCRLMKVHYLRGDRTSALRQYQICSTALREELEIEPLESTNQLYRTIRADALNCSDQSADIPTSALDKQMPMLVQTLQQLRQAQIAFAAIQLQVQDAIKIVECTLRDLSPGQQHD